MVTGIFVGYGLWLVYCNGNDIYSKASFLDMIYEVWMIVRYLS